MRRFWFALILLLGGHGSKAAGSEPGVVLCNGSEHLIQFIMIYKHGHTWGEPPSWPLKGFYEIESSDCTQVLNGTHIDAVFSISKIVEDHKSYLAPLAPGNTDELAATGSAGIEWGLCIPPQAPYDGHYEDNFNDYRQCNGDDIRVIFNLYVQTGSDIRYTVTIP